MDQQALQEALEEMHEASFHWALSCCQWDHHRAEELIQTCYLKVLDGRARFRGESTLKTWFFAVIKHTARENYRRQRIRETGYLKLFYEIIARNEETVYETTDYDDNEQKQHIRSCLTQLPGRQRQIIELVFYQDLTIVEAAKVCGIGVGSARTHYDRGKKKLHELLSNEQH
jgi:RNA polymerase sigma-70 factor (ECF subfamily)